MDEVKKTLDVQDVKDYLGIDYTDDMTDRRLTRAMAVSDAFLKGALGENYPVDDYRAQELALMIIADVYDHRELTAKEQVSYRKLAHDFELQLRLEMRL